MQRAFEGTGIKVPEDKKLKVGIIGGGLGGMITAMELSDAGHDVEILRVVVSLVAVGSGLIVTVTTSRWVFTYSSDATIIFWNYEESGSF